MIDRDLRDMLAREQLIVREQAENDVALIKARRAGRNITFTAADGCEVTATPTGHIFHDAADWW